MGISDSKETKIESSRPEQLMIHVYLDDIRKSIIQFETYCGNVGFSKEVIYDTESCASSRLHQKSCASSRFLANSIQIIKPLTHHEVKIAAINLRHKYKDIDTKISVLRSFLGKLDPSFPTNNEALLVQDFFSTLDKSRFNGIYSYKSAYINALKRLGIQ